MKTTHNEDFLKLDPAKIHDTAEILSRRISERFPSSGLASLSLKLLSICAKAEKTSRDISKNNVYFQIGTMLLSSVIVFMAVKLIAQFVQIPTQKISFVEFMQLLESSINVIILAGAGIFFLITLDSRIKRRRALAAIHELRVISHIIDMHQLTKDPEMTIAHGYETPSSPKRKMTVFKLNRYLDYCCEMLSLVGNISALYIQNFDDPVAISSAYEIESLTNGTSRKIWQKIMILHNVKFGPDDEVELE